MNVELLIILSFCLSFLIFFVGIKILKKEKIGQEVRKLGPKSHYSKEGTPNLGGLFIIFSTIIIFIIMIIYLNIKIDYPKIIMLFMPLILYGVLGFFDDYMKIKQRKNDGLSPKSKLIFQIVWATIYFFVFLEEENTLIKIFNITINLRWAYGLLILFFFVASSNAFNLSDGLDGLSGGIAILILLGLSLISNNRLIDAFIISLIIPLCVFLIFNFHPAKIFMGDTGSLAIGATIANLFIILKHELLLIIFGLLLIIETVSVIIQVFVFRIRKKRVFKMAPLHHHFELCGWREESVVFLFWIIQGLLMIIGVYVFYKYA